MNNKEPKLSLDPNHQPTLEKSALETRIGFAVRDTELGLAHDVKSFIETLDNNDAEQYQIRQDFLFDHKTDAEVGIRKALKEERQKDAEELALLFQIDLEQIKNSVN